MSDVAENKRQRLFWLLSGIVISNALLAEIIAAKIFSLEKTLGLPAAQLPLLGFTVDFNLSAGTLLWPVVFVTTDLLNEYFGKEGVRRISYLTAGLIAYGFIVLFFSIALEPADFWVATYKGGEQGGFDIDRAYAAIFGQGMRIIVASLTAFLVSQLVDVLVFTKLKQATGARLLWLRATGSTLVSQLVDSYVVLFIAFAGVFPTAQIFAIGFTSYLYKFVVALVMTPIVYLGHGLIDRYLAGEPLRLFARGPLTPAKETSLPPS